MRVFGCGGFRRFVRSSFSGGRRLKSKAEAPRPELLVRRPHYLDAAWTYGDCVDYLSIYRSPVVETIDEWYAPIVEALSRRCYQIELQEIIRDPDFVLGRVVWTLATVYSACPGEDVTHLCAYSRIEMPARRMGDE
jgi:hypothetical protein